MVEHFGGVRNIFKASLTELEATGNCEVFAVPGNVTNKILRTKHLDQAGSEANRDLGKMYGSNFLRTCDSRGLPPWP